MKLDPPLIVYGKSEIRVFLQTHFLPPVAVLNLFSHLSNKEHLSYFRSCIITIMNHVISCEMAH